MQPDVTTKLYVKYLKNHPDKVLAESNTRSMEHVWNGMVLYGIREWYGTFHTSSPQGLQCVQGVTHKDYFLWQNWVNWGKTDFFGNASKTMQKTFISVIFADYKVVLLSICVGHWAH